MNSQKINWRFALLFTGLLTIALTGYFYLHARQVRRQSELLPLMAERYVADGKTSRALRTLSRYMIDHPNDLEVRLRYARLMIAAKPDPTGMKQALDAYARVLEKAPERNDVRAELAKTLLDLGNWKDAIPLLEELHKTDPKERWVIEGLGRSLAFEQMWSKVELVLTPVCLTGPSPESEDYARLAESLRRQDKKDEADQVMEKLIKDHPTEASAFLVRAGYRKQYDVNLVQADLDKAKQLAPSDPKVALARASNFMEIKNPKGAFAELESFLKTKPENVSILQLAAFAQSQLGNKIEAVALLRRATAASPLDGAVALNLAQALVDIGDWQAAQKQVLATKLLSGVDADDLGLVEARLKLDTGDWPGARRDLRALQDKFVAAKKPVEPIKALLARCYALAGDIETELAFAREASTGGNIPGQLVYASALSEAGRLDEAIDIYRQVLKQDRAPASAAFGLAQLLVIRLSLPGVSPRASQWAEVDRLLDRAEAAVPTAWEIPVLRAEAMLSRDKPAEAKIILEKGRKKFPKEGAIWAASAAAEAREERFEQAEKLLDEGVKSAGDSIEQRMTRLRIRFAGKGDKLAAIQALGRDIDNFSSGDKIRIWKSMAEGFELIDRPQEAADAIDKVIAKKPNDLPSLLRRFDYAMRLKDTAAIDRAVEAIRRTDGDDGALVEYIAAYRIVRSVREKTAGIELLSEARRHLEVALIRRRSLAKAALLLAEVEDLSGNSDLAVDALVLAFKGGERSFVLLRRLVEYYSERRQFDEADSLIKEIQGKGRLNPAASRAFADIYLQAPDYARAVELAKQAVDSDSKNAADFLWLARVSFAADRPVSEIEEAIRKAIALAGDTPEPWAALVRYLYSTSRKAEAVDILAQIQKSVSADKVSTIMAPCQEALGDIAKAEASYLAALKEKPSDLRLAQGAAAFFTRNSRWEQAEMVLRSIVTGKILAKPKDIADARRDLAMALGFMGGQAKLDEARELLQQNSKDEASQEQSDNRIRAIILAQNRMTQRAAYDILDAEFKKRPFSSADLFLFARLAWSTEQFSRAEQAMVALVGSEKSDPDYLLFYIEMLLGRGELDSASFWLTNLIKARPGDLQTVRMQAILSFKQGQKARATERLRSYSPKSPDELIQLSSALEEIGDIASAENILRDYVRKENTPEAKLLLARFLGRASRYSEAIEIAEAVRSTLGTDLVVVVVVDLLRSGASPPTADLVRRVEGWLPSPADAKTGWLPLWQLAELADIREDQAESVNRFRKAVVASPLKHLVVPGLARLLCLTGGSEELTEAGALVANEIPAMPSNADELNELTALVLLKQGQTQKAIESLKRTALTAPSRRVGFYLSQALLDAGLGEEAKVAWQSAIDRGLKDSELHPLERLWWKKLSAQMTKKQ